MQRFVSYLRVSTKRQGDSGLGLEAQRAAIHQYLGERQQLAEHVEVESGKRNDRPELKHALATCRATGATLVIARLDRLARNAAFLLNLRDAGIEFVAVDQPNANRLTVGILALIAEDEGERISARTKAALAAAKARGVQLGTPSNLSNHAVGRSRSAAARSLAAQARAHDVEHIISDIRARGVTSATGIAWALNERSVPAPRGGSWTTTQTQRMLRRLAPS
ncbi:MULTISPECIES: recombinase family protein [unclassified Inquilinus]|uniref:recombinase family protein n=1 Tax=unclassified Inquilinus TaxID=2645927 RepID=UPI003F90DD02